MERPVCAGLFFTPMIHVNGDVTTCCLDEGLENRLGNVNQTPLAALWNGPTLRAWRLAQARGDFAGSGPYCTRCSWRSAGGMPREDVARYAESQGEPALAARIRSQA